MTLDRIWAGWRASYIAQTSGPPAGGDGSGECLFCAMQRLDDAEALILERVPLTFTVMNAYPYTSGHVMIVPRRHVAGLGHLTPDEGGAVFAALQRAVTALQGAFHPDGLNLGANLGRVAGAGVPGHFHMHALPRWDGDTNFMTTVAEARVLPEDIRTTYERLRTAWPSDDPTTAGDTP